jgi:hypothetical protein
MVYAEIDFIVQTAAICLVNLANRLSFYPGPVSSPGPLAIDL